MQTAADVTSDSGGTRGSHPDRRGSKGHKDNMASQAGAKATQEGESHYLEVHGGRQSRTFFRYSFKIIILFHHLTCRSVHRHASSKACKFNLLVPIFVVVILVLFLAQLIIHNATGCRLLHHK
jgi:hypothetical protein